MKKNILRQTSDAGIDFLRTELQAGLTFARVARTTSRLATRQRNQRNASTALQAVVKFKRRVTLSGAQHDEIENGLTTLREAIAAITATPSRGARAPARSRLGRRGSEKAS